METAKHTYAALGVAILAMRSILPISHEVICYEWNTQAHSRNKIL